MSDTIPEGSEKSIKGFLRSISELEKDLKDQGIPVNVTVTLGVQINPRSEDD